MRKNSPRKWLHAVLDFLPIIVIPVFMIYSHRHTIDNYTVVRSEPLQVNAFQFIENGFPSDLTNTLNTWSIDDGDVSLYQNTLTFDDYGVVYSTYDISLSNGNKFYYSCDYIADGSFDGNFFVELNDTNTFIFEDADAVGSISNIFTLNSDFDGVIGLSFDGGAFFQIYNIQFFNLTDIFGSGNEPSADVFKSYLVQDYYNYGNNTLNVGFHNVTYNDTDIGSQFVYTMYNTTEKYFNFNKVFNLQGFYNWIEVNLFGGNAPLMASVVWNIIVYEFVIDILFVFYAFFMFLIDFTECLLEKPFDKGR